MNLQWGEFTLHPLNVGKTAAGASWACFHHFRHLLSCVLMLKKLGPGQKEHPPWLCSLQVVIGVDWVLGLSDHYWSKPSYLSYLRSRGHAHCVAAHPGWLGLLTAVHGVRWGSSNNFVSSVPLVRGVNLCTCVMLDCVVYTYARIRLYFLMHLMPTALFQTLFEVGWTAKLVLFLQSSVSHVPHTPPALLALFSGLKERISWLVSPPGCVYIQM